MDLWPLALFAVLMAINAPVAMAIAAGALLFFLDQQGLPLIIFPQRLMSASGSFPLVAIPMFVLAGVVMNYSGITRRLLNLAEALVGHMPGALAQMNVVLATLMGFESGSGNADAAMQAKMLGTEMVRRNYAAPFAAAIVAASAVITPIIPPGLGFVIYGYLANVSVGRLFLAGVVPGFLLMASLMIVTHVIAKRQGYRPVRDRVVTAPELLVAVRDAGWALTVPVFIVVGLRNGLFTPTEAGAVIALYSLVVGFVAHRELRIAHLWPILTEASLATASVMIIISAADAFGFYMTMEQVPSTAARWLSTLTSSPTIMLFLINILLLIVGMFIESVAALIMLTPILAAVGIAVGIDPVHLGLVIVLNITIGAITPPVGTLMFIACGVLKVTVAQYSRAILPLLGAQLAVLTLLILVPGLVTFLPNLMMGPGR
ncbi:MAG: TRAP transporter large permease [Alphaproteobacteria bacterium]|nr:TRAP transporter large permease [Alphaproteobacteria bacterium]